MENRGFEDWDNFLNKASLGVHLVGSDGKILWANDLELQLLGYEREEYVNRHIAEFHVDRVQPAANGAAGVYWCLKTDA